QGTAKVSTQQPCGRLAVDLLDPRGPDSCFRWGFVNQMFQQAEYMETYAMVPLANKMLAENPGLKKEFEQKKARDRTFSNDKRAQLKWFYQRSPYYDNRYLKYPVLMEYE
ncbi:MAG: hypothetical protein GY940_11150, partial [bacterium]|nr:hypothetical protein [bacterium]